MHLYYIEIIQELYENIKNIVVPFNLFITTPFESFVPKILDLSKEFDIPVNIYICTNMGRDIYPFLKLYRSGLLDNSFALAVFITCPLSSIISTLAPLVR